MNQYITENMYLIESDFLFLQCHKYYSYPDEMGFQLPINQSSIDVFIPFSSVR
jgi:hypothetical protein